jgi:threonyl-tRNA synthetase
LGGTARKGPNTKEHFLFGGIMKKENKNLETLRHSASHVLAQAVIQMFPEAKLAIGPAIENGFYYDFDLPRTLIPEDLEILEKKMSDIIKSNLEIKPEKLTKVKALAFVKKIQQPYKAELIKDLKDKEVSFFRQGDFIDLCKGPHLDSTGEIPAFKLLKTSGAYWRGDEKNKMLQRIYGTAFYSEKDLRNYLNQLEEAEKRDHKKIGPQLGLFMFHETAPGMPYWLPKGLKILNQLISFWREEHEKRDYLEVKTPLINKKELYEISGHWSHYREEMFLSETDENETYALKPMNCPNAMVIFGNELRSYKDLPLRFGDTDTLHRNERSGTLNGLLRVREFSQDDAHIFLREDQIEDEYKRLFEIVDRFYSIFNLEYSFRLGTRPDKFMGDVKIWDKAERELKKILKESGKDFTVLDGDGAFYGPKIDILMKDSLKREWQMGTLQLDFQIPQRFGLKYIDEKSKEKTPVVIHRVVYGSLERFMGILTEHFAGAFPLWLSPVQIVILPISDKKHLSYAKDIAKVLKESKIRVEIDDRAESIGKRIRESEIQKIPYMIIVGDKEKQAGNVSVRSYAKGDSGSQKIKDFVEKILIEIEKKK